MCMQSRGFDLFAFMEVHWDSLFGWNIVNEGLHAVYDRQTWKAQW